MFASIISSSLRFRYLVLSVAAAVLAFGVLQVRSLPVDVLPEFAPPVVEVQTEAIGLSAEEVESMITYSLEELLSGVPWIESTRSRSVTGLSSVLLIFKRGTDVLKARQMVQERLALAYTLPNVATPPVILQPMSATSRFMMVGLSSDTVDITELSLLARWTIKPKLVGVPGVSNVSVWGQRLRQLHVHFDPNRLRDSKVTQEDIVAATGDALWVSPLTFLKASSPGSGGWIDNSNQRLGVEHMMPIETPEDMAKIAVTSPHLLLGGRSLALGDVAETTFSHAPLIGDAIVGQGKQGLMLVIEKFPNTNTLDVTRGVDAALAELRRGLPGVKVDADVFRLANYVQDSISNLSRALLIGVLLALAVLTLHLGNWRSALVAAISLPVTLGLAVLGLRWVGGTINTMVMAGLIVALAVVIDIAIVDAQGLRERLQERLRQRTQARTNERAASEANERFVSPALVATGAPAQPSAMRVIYETTLHSQRTAVFATLVMALAVVPAFFLAGVSAAFYEPLAVSYLLVIAATLVVALTLTPALSMLLAPRDDAPAAAAQGTPPTQAPQSPASWAQGLVARHSQGLRALVARPMAGAAVAGGLVVAAAAVWPLLGHSLLPPLKEQQLLVNWSTPPGTSHAETTRITQRVTKELETVEGVRSVGGHVGRAVTGDQVVGVNSSQIWVNLAAEADREKTIAAVRSTLDGYPGVEHSVQSYLRDKVGEVMTGQSKPIVVRIFGPQREVLAQKAEEVRAAVASLAGVVDLSAEGQVQEPHVQVKVNLEAAGKANVKPGDVRRSAASVFSGMVVGYLFKEQRIFEVVVWGAPESRQNLSSLANLWVEKSDRSHARLGDIAEVAITSTPTMMRHEGRAPYVDVVMGVQGRDASAVAAEVAQRVAGVKFPLEYHPEVLGEFTQSRQNTQRLVLALVAVVIGVLLLLQACLRNWGLAAVGLTALLASLAGAVLVAAASGGVVTLGTTVGLLAVWGIAARHHLMLLMALQEQAAGQGGAAPLERVLQLTGARLPALAASVLATIVAVLPIIVLGFAAGLEVVRPIAIVLIGGLVISTLVTLFVVPALFMMVAASAPREIELGSPAQAEPLATPAMPYMPRAA